MATLAIKKIRLDGGTQPRAAINPFTVDDYADDMKRGDKFPSPDVFFDGTDYWLARGFHRVTAAERIGRKSIDVTIHQGTRRDAVLFSVGDNASHGLRRTTDDKTRCVVTLLGDDEWSKWSDRKIAELCRVSHTFVSGIRAAVSGNVARCERLATRNGTTYSMNTAGLRGGGDVVKAARDLIRETPLADDRGFIHKLGLVCEDRQCQVAQLIIDGTVKTIAQAERQIERQAKARQWKADAAGVELGDDDCTIHVGDCRDVLADVADRSVDLVFTDPPYGINEQYAGFDDNLSRDQLMSILEGFASHLPRILTPNGSAFVMMSSRYAIDVAQVLDKAGLYRQDTIIWAESFGPHNSHFWTDSYRVIHHYTRDPDTFTFNATDTRTFIPSWRNENGDDRQDKDGKLPGNVWGVWTDRAVARVVGNAGERIPDDRAVNQLPVKLAERIVLIASNPGDVVLDPFHGTGTTARAAIPHKRRYIGIEIDPAQAKASRHWIKAMIAQAGKAAK